MTDQRMSIDIFVNQIINLEDTLHFQIQLANERILDLKKKKLELQSWIEGQTNNFREEVHSNPLLYINILEASNLESNIDPFVKILCGANVYRTQIIKNSKNPIWNESYKMFVLFHFRNFNFSNKVHCLKVKISQRSGFCSLIGKKITKEIS